MDTTAVVESLKKDILEDIASGRVPATVSSFSELHDYVDANEYGGFCEDAFQYDASDVDLVNVCQNIVDAWIKNRRPTHDCMGNAVQYTGDGPMGHGWECGICGKLLQVG